MAIAVASLDTSNWTSLGNPSGSVVITKPSGVVDGDLMIAVIGGLGGSGDLGITAPAGWTLIKHQTNSGTTLSIDSYYKVAASEGANYTWSWNQSGGGYGAGIVMRITGFDSNAASAIQSSTAGQNDSTTTPTVSSNTPIYASSLLILGFVSDANGSTDTYAIVTSNPTWTEQADITTTGKSFAVATAVRTQITATDNGSAVGPSGNWVSEMVVVNPSQPATVTPSAVTVTATIQAPAISVGIAITQSAVTVTTTIQAPGITTAPTWTNTAKSATPTWSNTDKTG